jgi:hypothetical protein
MASSQYAQILQDDGFEQRRHQFVRGRANLLQAVNVGFRKYAALTSDFVELDPCVFQFGQLLRWDLQFGIDFIDDRAGPARALVVHRGDFFLAPSLVIIFEDDDFGVLTAEFNDRVDFGMQLLYSQGNGGNLLHEFRTDLVSNRATA